MSREKRRVLTDPAAVRALAHPVRLDLLNHLMAHGSATASGCARAVGDTPSNCSYHLRVLARHGLVEPEDSADGRERPWRACITGFDTPGDPDDPGSDRSTASAELVAISVQREHRLLSEHLVRRHEAPAPWRDADGYATYTLRCDPDELRGLTARLDALIRPYIAATRQDAPAGARLVHAAFYAFPQLPGDVRSGAEQGAGARVADAGAGRREPDGRA